MLRCHQTPEARWAVVSVLNGATTPRRSCHSVGFWSTRSRRIWWLTPSGRCGRRRSRLNTRRRAPARHAMTWDLSAVRHVRLVTLVSALGCSGCWLALTDLWDPCLKSANQTIRQSSTSAAVLKRKKRKKAVRRLKKTSQVQLFLYTPARARTHTHSEQKRVSRLWMFLEAD